MQQNTKNCDIFKKFASQRCKAMGALRITQDTRKHQRLFQNDSQSSALRVIQPTWVVWSQYRGQEIGNFGRLFLIFLKKYAIQTSWNQFLPRHLLFFLISTKAQPWEMAGERVTAESLVDVRRPKNHEKSKISISFKIDFWSHFEVQGTVRAPRMIQNVT